MIDLALHKNRFIHILPQILPGFILAVTVGLAASFLSEHYTAPAMLFALLLGLSLSFLYEETKCQAGIEWVSGTVLKLGVALLGIRLAFHDLVALGWQTGLMLVFGVVSTILFGIMLARFLGLAPRFGALTGGAVAICGASAAAALSAVLPKDKDREQQTILAVIGVTSLSTIAMVLYPIIGHFLGFSELEMGVFLGGTIHDVAQVVGAGYSISTEAGDLATLTKLVRVSLLMPVVLCFLWVLRSAHQDVRSGKTPGIPLFLIAFFVLMVLNSIVQIPEAIKAPASDFSRFCLITAIAAIGIKSNLKSLIAVGTKPVILMVGETLWLACVIVGALVLV